MTLKAPDRAALWAKEWMEWEFIEFMQRYNIAPTDRVTIGRRRATKAEAVKLSWGIKGYDGELRTIARADNALKLHAKRLRTRRCVVFADGFYEWQRVSKKETNPYFFQLKGEQPFCLAGIYSESSDGFMIFTTDPNEVVAKVHTRMPVMLDRERSLRWLDEAPLTEEQFKTIANPWPAEQMESRAVSRYVSKSGNEGPQCLEPPSAADSSAARAEPVRGKLIAEKENGEQLNLF